MIETTIADYLNSQNINFEPLTHAPFHTVEETLGAYTEMGIPENKSLFLRDEKKRRYFLVVLGGTKRANLKALAEIFGEKRLSFASEKDLEKYLKTYPGAVSPFGLLFDSAKDIEVYFDADLKSSDFIGFHPNKNTETWKLAQADFQKYLNSLPQDIKTMPL